MGYNRTLCQEYCTRSRYQGQGELVTSHRDCGMWLLVPAIYTCLWHTTSDMFFMCTSRMLQCMVNGKADAAYSKNIHIFDVLLWLGICLFILNCWSVSYFVVYAARWKAARLSRSHIYVSSSRENVYPMINQVADWLFSGNMNIYLRVLVPRERCRW